MNCATPETKPIGNLVAGGSDCYSNEILPYVSSLHALYMFIIPILFFLQISCVSMYVVWFNFFLSCFLYFLACAVTGHTLGIVAFVLWMLLGCHIIVDSQIRNILLFITKAKLTIVLEEKDRNELENRVNEMRSLIGNVAHDLKTVSILITCIYFTVLSLSFHYYSPWHHSLLESN